MCITNKALCLFFDSMKVTEHYITIDEDTVDLRSTGIDPERQHKELHPVVTPCEECNYLVKVSTTYGNLGYLATDEHGYFLSTHRKDAMVASYRDVKFSLYSFIKGRYIVSYYLRTVLMI